MSFRRFEMPTIQDMPPPGGFKNPDLSRSFRPRGPTGLQIWGTTILFMSYGFYTVGKHNHLKAEQRLEDRRIRYSISPYLQAESDLVYTLLEKENLKREAEIMKDVNGWNVGESWYFSRKFMPRAIDPLSKTRQ